MSRGAGFAFPSKSRPIREKPLADEDLVGSRAQTQEGPNLQIAIVDDRIDLLHHCVVGRPAGGQEPTRGTASGVLTAYRRGYCAGGRKHSVHVDGGDSGPGGGWPAAHLQT